MKKLDITQEDAIHIVRELYDKHSKVTTRILEKEAPFSQTYLKNRLGLTFNQLLESADIPYNFKTYSKEEVIKDVMKVYKKCNGKMTKDDYIKYGKYSRKPIDRLFGSWNTMLKELGLLVNCEINIPEENLLEELRRLVKEQGICTSKIIKENSKYSVEIYQRRFGNLNTAYEKAGLETRKPGRPVTANKVIADISCILDMKPEPEHTFDWLVNPGTGKNLRIDAFFPELNLAVEYNGEQHHKEVEYYSKGDPTDALYKRIYLDGLKYNLLKEHGIKILVIEHDKPTDRISLIKKIASIV